MTRTKIFLLWLLAFAIPLQGFAATVQAACAPAHQQHQMTAATQASASTHHMHGGDAAATAEVAALSHAMHASAGEAPATGHDGHPHQASTSCSSCAACCVGALLPLALNDFSDLPRVSAIYGSNTAHGFVGYTPENPERPPSVLA
ncbi:hypothetical protein [Herbaspirillum autotrophicum]|uniref:hypothetical protein n=1 Tax=Herbaspirillum autotrophicum TaxID=180195 RepID=UPI00067DC511|nr:hypothetical protein [Herbaspirillum autotrophicum]